MTSARNKEPLRDPGDDRLDRLLGQARWPDPDPGAVDRMQAVLHARLTDRGAAARPGGPESRVSSALMMVQLGLAGSVCVALLVAIWFGWQGYGPGEEAPDSTLPTFAAEAGIAAAAEPAAPSPTHSGNEPARHSAFIAAAAGPVRPGPRPGAAAREALHLPDPSRIVETCWPWLVRATEHPAALQLLEAGWGMADAAWGKTGSRRVADHEWTRWWRSIQQEVARRIRHGLRSNEPRVRLAAARIWCRVVPGERLGELRPWLEIPELQLDVMKAVLRCGDGPALYSLACSAGDPRVRQRAMRSLLRRGTAGDVELFLGLVHDPARSDEALSAARSVRQAPLHLLIPRLAGQRPLERNAALRVLAVVPDRRTEQVLWAALGVPQIAHQVHRCLTVRLGRRGAFAPSGMPVEGVPHAREETPGAS